MQNVLAEGRLKPSSNDAMVNSLTDGSTETFWESRDEPRSKTKALMVTFNDDKKLYAAAVHNDNGKDSGVCIQSAFSHIPIFNKAILNTSTRYFCKTTLK